MLDEHGARGHGSSLVAFAGPCTRAANEVARLGRPLTR